MISPILALSWAVNDAPVVATIDLPVPPAFATSSKYLYPLALIPVPNAIEKVLIWSLL